MPPPLLLALLLACPGPRSAPEPQAGCVGCHAGDAGGIHAAIACTACHGGDPGASEAEAAHRGLEREPGALDSAERSCGACHPEQLASVRTSLMTTGSGIIAVDRWAMGELPSPTGHETMAELLVVEQPSPAQDHLRRLCAGCHLGTRRDNRDDAVRGTGSGCAACHSEDGHGPHPLVVSAPSDTSCLGCHSRSGRISLAWMGLYEHKGDAPCVEPQTLFDGRAACRAEADVHARAGMSCVDCHLHTDLMGDGRHHAHAEEQVEIRCESCHGPNAPQVPWKKVEDPRSWTLLRLRGQERPPDEPARLGSRGTPLWNLRPTPPPTASDRAGIGDAPGWTLQAKRGERSWAVSPTPTGAAHPGPGHERLRCDACHSTWAPDCVSCHTRYDPAGQQWDFGRAAEAPGAWIEHSDQMGARPPALGVLASGEIVPAIPGMIATLETGDGPPRTLRHFAPTAPHTTSREGRSCASCHRDPRALGLGSGTLELGPGGVQFQASAADGWTTLRAPVPGVGTRPGMRSLNATEQLRVLRVGVCLPCHGAPEDAVYADFGGAIRRVLADRGRCALPAGRWRWLYED